MIRDLTKSKRKNLYVLDNIDVDYVIESNLDEGGFLIWTMLTKVAQCSIGSQAVVFLFIARVITKGIAHTRRINRSAVSGSITNFNSITFIDL
jgi:hypothetical protein